MALIQSQKDLRFVSGKSFILLLSLISLRILSQEWNFNFIKSSSKLTEKIISIFFPFGLFKWKTLWLLLFDHSVVSNSLWPHGLQHTRLPCPSHLLELAQTHVHWVSDAIQASHPLSFLSPPAFYLSQHQGLFQWTDTSHQVATVLHLHFQHQSFQWIFRITFL